jgi:hypothetical protein
MPAQRSREEPSHQRVQYRIARRAAASARDDVNHLARSRAALAAQQPLNGLAGLRPIEAMQVERLRDR